MAWATSDRAARLPRDWDAIRTRVRDRAQGRCQAPTTTPTATASEPNQVAGPCDPEAEAWVPACEHQHDAEQSDRPQRHQDRRRGGARPPGHDREVSREDAPSFGDERPVAGRQPEPDDDCHQGVRADQAVGRARRQQGGVDPGRQPAHDVDRAGGPGTLVGPRIEVSRPQPGRRLRAAIGLRGGDQIAVLVGRGAEHRVVRGEPARSRSPEGRPRCTRG